MNRREVLLAGGCGVVALTSVGVMGLSIRQSFARDQLHKDLLDDAVPALAGNAAASLGTLPARAREAMFRYFDGRCLNVAPFVDHVCSETFTNLRRRCRSPQEREHLFLRAFCRLVASEEEILGQVHAVAADVGAELDAAWAAYCEGLPARWDVHLKPRGGPLHLADMTGRLEGTIRAELGAAMRAATSDHQVPAVRPTALDTACKIGVTAVSLLPLARYGWLGAAVGVPVFFLLAAREVAAYATATDEARPAGFQAQVSRRLARLGTLVGREFEREVTERLADLYAWQEKAVRDGAAHLAAERVHLLS